MIHISKTIVKTSKLACPQREGAARSDAERERRARGDWESRTRAAEADAARLAGKLHAAQREIARYEHSFIFMFLINYSSYKG